MATTITPTIVTVDTTVTQAPAVSQLQQSGAIISTGGTTLTAGTYQYLASASALTSILAAPLALTSLVWASGTVTATAVANLPLTSGEVFTTTIAGAVPTGYNGTYLATVTGLNTFTFALATDPGAETTPGTYLPSDAAFVSDAVSTFFSQGQSVGVYVLELGAEATNAAAITALDTWITANPGIFYAFLLPEAWDVANSTAINTLANKYSSPSGQTYFFTTTTLAHVTTYDTNKAVWAVIESPTALGSEVQAASMFYQWLVNKPGSANPLAPMAYRYLQGVTPWVQQGNSSSINSALTAYANIVLTGAEGGISNATLFKGTTMDGKQAAFWYGVDWFRIQVKQAIAAAIINGSNSNPPLLYNQAGINTLQAIAQSVGNSAVAFGCALSVSVSAVDFVTYTTQNPNDYAAGIYNGLSATLVGTSGFLTVTFALDATTFV